MKKKFFGALAVVALAAAITFNVNFNSQDGKLPSVSLDNIEALADESGNYRCNKPYTEHCATEGSYKLPGVKGPY